MFDESPKRFDRVIAILIQLQSKKIVKAQELAERFEVSLRTIYRDIRTLEASGVPIYGEAGIGYSLVDGYRLPPVMFTREEASSFIAAEKLMEKFIDKELGQHYQSAMYKLKSVMQSSDKDWISGIESKVVIQPTRGNLFNDNVPDAMSILFKSVADKTQVILDYQAIEADVPSQRTIEPVGVFHEYNNWYVFGFCHLRKDYRQFRADRIEGIKKTQNTFIKEHETLDTYLARQNETPTTKVRILIDRKISKYISSEKRHHGFVSQKNVGDLVEMTFLSRDTENGFARWFMMFADFATILEPKNLNLRILELMDLYKNKLEKKNPEN